MSFTQRQPVKLSAPMIKCKKRRIKNVGFWQRGGIKDRLFSEPKQWSGKEVGMEGAKWMEIRNDRLKGMSYTELGRKYHIDPRTAKRYAESPQRPEYTLSVPNLQSWMRTSSRWISGWRKRRTRQSGYWKNSKSRVLKGNTVLSRNT